MKVLLVAVMALTLSGVQEKTYDLKLDWKPVKGHRSDLDETGMMKLTIKLAGQGEVVNNSEDTAFTARETILAADGAGGSERTWAFSRASQEKDGQKTKLGFLGRTVLIKHKRGTPREFSLEGGGELSDDDLAALRKAFMGSSENEQPGKPSGSDLFAPKKPVKVGESWSPDIPSLVRGMFDDQMAASADLQNSRAVFTLKSVERRDGAEFGKIDGLMELALGSMGPMQFAKPIVFRVTISLDACIDGKLPDGAAVMSIEMKGTSAVPGPAGPVDLTVDMLANVKKTVATVR